MEVGVMGEVKNQIFGGVRVWGRYECVDVWNEFGRSVFLLYFINNNSKNNNAKTTTKTAITTITKQQQNATKQQQQQNNNKKATNNDDNLMHSGFSCCVQKVLSPKWRRLMRRLVEREQRCLCIIPPPLLSRLPHKAFPSPSLRNIWLQLLAVVVEQGLLRSSNCKLFETLN